MVQRVFACYSLHWVVNEHLLHQVDSFRGDLGAKFVKFSSSPLGEGGLEFFELADVFPEVFIGRSHDLEHLEDLVDFGVSAKQNSLMGNFIKNAPNRPNIHGRVVNFCSQQHFGRSVPKRDNFVGVLLDWVVISAGQSEICQLNVQLIPSVN
jgi:hypothetical protein